MSFEISKAYFFHDMSALLCFSSSNVPYLEKQIYQVRIQSRSDAFQKQTCMKIIIKTLHDRIQLTETIDEL